MNNDLHNDVYWPKYDLSLLTSRLRILGFIPYHKSLIIRMGILDLINTHHSCQCLDFLTNNLHKLPDDLIVLRNVLLQWKSKNEINVGESGTIYRFLKFYCWKNGIKKRFVLEGTLKNREICNNPDIVNMPVSKLLELDNNTQQWASASILVNSSLNPVTPIDKLIDIPIHQYTYQTTYPKLFLTIECKKEWKKMLCMDELASFASYNKLSVFDPNIERQAISYVLYRLGERMSLAALSAEDYCLSRAFGKISVDKAKSEFKSLRGHESNRLEEMEKALVSNVISSKDHRVVQAMVMKNNHMSNVVYPQAVNKSWPQFWKFMEFINKHSDPEDRMWQDLKIKY